MMEDSW